MPDYSKEEFLVSVLARELASCTHVVIGTAAPVHASAALLAAELADHQIRVTMLGGKETIFSDGMREMFDAALQGRVDGFVLGGGQIDGGANVNFLGRGKYPDLSVRWPGNFGSPILYSAIRNVVLFREEHSRRVLVPQVDFISAAGPAKNDTHRKGGPKCLLTERCIFDFSYENGRFELRSIHEGSNLNDIIANTGFDFGREAQVAMTPVPSEKELGAIRGKVVAKIRDVYPEFAATLCTDPGPVGRI